ncbi:MAG TPA: PilZ domain-containing protein [Candidatus Sulfotelmatobacter sp.]|nr:PilZ domain-containing protein [Candidatus Sulfotelmatobacter sp.]
MTTATVRIERRVGQRFAFLLPVSIRVGSTEIEGHGFTQDLSSRGAFLFTDAPVEEGAEIELTLRMPSEITLGESMRVRCRGRVLRVSRPSVLANSANGAAAETKIGVAVRFESYEYLSESTIPTGGLARISALHPGREENEQPGRVAPVP